jgi:hypothetical protein
MLLDLTTHSGSYGSHGRVSWSSIIYKCEGLRRQRLLSKGSSEESMASKPGILTDWPWKSLGSLKVSLSLSLSLSYKQHTHEEASFLEMMNL